MHLRDAHLHLIAHGAELSAVHLADCSSLDACLALIARGAEHAPPGAWIRAVGARPEAWPERRYPTADELETAAGARPCYVLCFDHHACSASRTALKRAHIDDAPAPGAHESPFIPIDARGRPTGVLLEDACKRLLRAVPKPSEEETLGNLRAAQDDLLARGYVEVHDMMADVQLARLLHQLDRAGDLKLAVRLYATPDDFDETRAFFAEHETSERIVFAGLKLFTDGTLNSRTASMLTDYADPIPHAPRGSQLLSNDQLRAHMQRASAQRFDVAAHAIGDAAVRALLDAFESIDASERAITLRIEHAQFIDEADIDRFARLGVVASLQPCHLLTDIEAIRRLMPHRADRAFPLRDLADACERAGRDPAELIYLGSDTPVVDPDPNDNIQAAVHRRRAAMPQADAIAPEQAIDEELARRLMRSCLEE